MFKEGLKFEDEEFTPRVLIAASNVKYISKNVYIYRRRENSITTSMCKNNNWVKDYKVIINSFIKMCQEIEDKECIKQLHKRASQFVLSLMKNPLSYGANEKDLKDIKNMIVLEKLYEIPSSDKNFAVRIQGNILKNPDKFEKLYKTLKRGVK